MDEEGEEGTEGEGGEEEVEVEEGEEGEEGDGGEDEEGEAPIPAGRVVASVTKHKPYHGAMAGSLDNVWFTIKYTDGSATGKRGEVEAPTILTRTAEGRAAVLRYVRTKKGKSAAKYVPENWYACSLSRVQHVGMNRI